MTSLMCKNCDHENNAKDGICTIKNAGDGIPVRCVGGWSREKLFYLKRYVDTFTTSMRNKWKGELYYIDLFAGPGKCIVRDNEEEIDSSPLIALNAKFPFKKYYFVDLNGIALEALLKRCKSHQYEERTILLNDDCNKVVHSIVENIPKLSLSMAFIDPTGLDFKFATVEKLAHRKVDLIITYPDSMAISRNLPKFLREEHCSLDDFIGDSGWRKCKSLREVTEYYKKKLHSLDYQEIMQADEIQIRSLAKNLPLYTLFFASKHPLGKRFWQEISEINHTGQRKLKFSL